LTPLSSPNTTGGAICLQETVAANLCANGRLDAASKWCCAGTCLKNCGGPNCGSADNGAGADTCCPARWTSSATASVCTFFGQSGCRMPAGCASLAAGQTRARTPRSTQRPSERTSSSTAVAARPLACSCYGRYTHAYRGTCLPSFMVIGSQKAATSKLRWYLSRHPSVDIPKEEAFHGGPNAVEAWDTKTNPNMLTSYLEAFEDVCNVSGRITGLKMPDYIVLSSRPIKFFYVANPAMRVLVTLREPVARMYSYFSMQLRFGWSPINHMGKNPCMQQRLRELQRQKEASGHKAANNKSIFTTEEIMVTNLICVKPCYSNNASGLGAEAEREIWHNEALPECRNIYFTPLVHSMYAMHIRRWRLAFAADSLLLLRFDDLVIRPLEVLQKLTTFLGVAQFANNFKVEIGRENFTTISRLLQTGAVTKESLKMLQDFFAPHDAMLHAMFPGQKFW